MASYPVLSLNKLGALSLMKVDVQMVSSTTDKNDWKSNRADIQLFSWF